MDYQQTQIAEIYDLANPWAQDYDFYLPLGGVRPCSFLDLGCGTGTLCCALAKRGHRVTGVDPAAVMLAVARSKPHAESRRDLHSERYGLLSTVTTDRRKRANETSRIE